MTTLRKVLPFTLLCAALSGLPLAAQTQDCSFTFPFTGNSTISVSNLSGVTPCVNWRITLSTDAAAGGTLSVTATFLTSPDNVTYTAVPNTICSPSVQPPCVLQGVNPIVGTQGMLYAASYGAYVRVAITASSGTGHGTIRAYGVKGASASALPSSGSGGGSGTVTSVSFTGGLVSVSTPTTTPALTVAGNSGGIPYFTSAATWGSSALLGLNRILLGGGAGGAPTVTAADTTTTHALFATAGAPAFRALASGDIPNNAANTSGNAATASALAALPSACSAGNYPLGILANGNATGCTPAGGGGGSTAVACPENPISMTATNTYTCTDNLGVATGKMLWCQDPNSTPANAAVQVSWAGATINTFTWVAATTQTVNCYASLGGSGSGGGGSGGLLPWNPAASAPPALSSWTQINTGGNGVFADVRGGVFLNTVSGINLKALVVPTPGASGSAFTMTGHLNGTCPTSSNSTEYGLIVNDATIHSVSFSCLANINGICAYQVDHSTSGIPLAAVYTGGSVSTPDPTWLRIVYDGTNLKFQISATGADAVSWTQLYTEAASVELTGNPATIGFFGYPSSGSPGSCKVTLGYWLVTQP